LFIVWWYALAGASFTTGIINLLGAIGQVDLPLFLAFSQVGLLALCVALCGLTYYFIYLFTGSRKALTPLIIFYLSSFTVLMYFVNSSDPTSISIKRWGVTMEYSQQPSGLMIALVVILLVFPQIIGGLAYFTLYFRVKDPTQKYRIAVVSWSILLWFLSSFLEPIAALSQYDWWQIFSRLIGLGVAFAILMAYQPPNWIKNRLGINAISEESN
jgi:hypothetical protein